MDFGQRITATIVFNRPRTYVKILTWDQDGLSLWSKRLESEFHLSSMRSTPNEKLVHADAHYTLNEIPGM